MRNEWVNAYIKPNLQGIHVCVCAWLCVRMRQSEREKETEREKKTESERERESLIRKFSIYPLLGINIYSTALLNQHSNEKTRGKFLRKHIDRNKF